MVHLPAISVNNLYPFTPVFALLGIIAVYLAPIGRIFVPQKFQTGKTMLPASCKGKYEKKIMAEYSPALDGLAAKRVTVSPADPYRTLSRNALFLRLKNKR